MLEYFRFIIVYQTYNSKDILQHTDIIKYEYFKFVVGLKFWAPDKLLK